MRIRYAIHLPAGASTDAAEQFRQWLKKPGWQDVLLANGASVEVIEPRPSMSPARVSVARARGR